MTQVGAHSSHGGRFAKAWRADETADGELAVADAYAEIVKRIRSLVDVTVPAGATVAVVSRGDANLLALTGRRGWHFPQTNEGTYAGHHPSDSEDAIAQLERLHARGAEYILFPATALWWLDHYEDFRRHLERWYRVLVDETDICVIFSLREPPLERPSAADERAEERYSELLTQVRELADRTLPPNAPLLALNEGRAQLLELLELDGRTATPFPAAEDAADEEAAAELESGADFLIVPATARWWLDCRPSLKRELARRYPLVVRQEHACDVYELSGSR